MLGKSSFIMVLFYHYCVYQAQNYLIQEIQEQPIFPYTARKVSDMLDTLLTDSTVSTDTEGSDNDIDSDLEFDLSDPEALAVKETDSIFPGGLDVVMDNEIWDASEFVSMSTVQDTPIFTSAADTTASNKDRQTGYGDNEDHIHISETSFV